MEEVNKENIIEMITHWSNTFGLPVKKGLGFPAFDRMRLAESLIAEEFKELQQATEDRNITEIQDALGDLLWVTVRAMMEYGIDPVFTIQRIYESNMSKADYSLDDMEFTRNKYLKMGIETYVEKVGDAFITHRKSDDKVVKSHNFKEPNFNLKQ